MYSVEWLKENKHVSWKQKNQFITNETTRSCAYKLFCSLLYWKKTWWVETNNWANIQSSHRSMNYFNWIEKIPIYFRFVFLRTRTQKLLTKLNTADASDVCKIKQWCQTQVKQRLETINSPSRRGTTTTTTTKWAVKCKLK